MNIIASVIQHRKIHGRHGAEHLFTYIVTVCLSKPALATLGDSMQGNGGFLKVKQHHNRCTADDKCCVPRTVSELAEYPRERSRKRRAEVL